MTPTAVCRLGGAVGVEQCACGEKSGVCGLLAGGPEYQSMALLALQPAHCALQQASCIQCHWKSIHLQSLIQWEGSALRC